MQTYPNVYIGGEWRPPIAAQTLDVINPANEQIIAQVALGGAADVDAAVNVARGAFDSYSLSSTEERIALLERIITVYESREEDIAQAVSAEMGCPISLSRKAQAPLGRQHFSAMLDVLRDFPFEEKRGDTTVVREPIGVCGLITPWNWPLNQIACKVAPALAAGCTMVLKPSERTPISGLIFAEVMAEAGVPAGVFNLVSGDGEGVGEPLARHPDVDMISFTGSTRGGISVALNAAPSVKRVTQELGGKSANIILDSADLEEAVSRGAMRVFSNSGQTCTAPTRMLVPAAKMAVAAAIAARAAESMQPGDPADEATQLGPVVCRAQYDRIQQLIVQGIEEGAKLAAGGPGRPDELTLGCYVRPTVFSEVGNDMTIAREEIFGPVLSMIAYDSEEDAIAIANDTPYGLAGYVQGDLDTARRVAKRLRAGVVTINSGSLSPLAPFGGYKRSGNGREWGAYGMEEFLETKALPGFDG
jgi:aldehyde dehydrogenase (NAD+)